MTTRSTEFYTVLDRMAEGKYATDTLVDVELVRADEANLIEMGSAALHAVGIPHKHAYFDKDFEGAGATSVVRRLDIQTDDLKPDQMNVSYAMRIQPEGFVDEYAPASDLARTVAWNNGVRTPRVYTSQATIAAETRHTFTVEDFVEGENGYDYCNNDLSQLPRVTRELGKLLARIHEQEVRGFGFFDTQTAKRGELVGQYSSYKEHIVAGLGQTVTRLLQYEQIDSTQATELQRYYHEASLLNELDEEKSVLSHGDPALYNLRVGNDGLPTIVDFGEARGAPVIHDLAVASLDLTRDGWQDAADMQQDYQEAGGELPSYADEAITAIRLRLLLSVVAGQSRFIKDNPQNTGIKPFFTRAVTALHQDAKKLRIFSSTRR